MSFDLSAIDPLRAGRIAPERPAARKPAEADAVSRPFFQSSSLFACPRRPGRLQSYLTLRSSSTDPDAGEVGNGFGTESAWRVAR